MMYLEQSIGEDAYVFHTETQVIIRQGKAGGEAGEVLLTPQEALKLGEWLQTYALNQFAAGQGTGE